MQIAARGFPEVTRSKKKINRETEKNVTRPKISQTFSLIVSNRFFISCRRICYASRENPRFDHVKEKNIYRNLKSAMPRYEGQD